MRIAVLQMTAGINPAANAATLSKAIADAGRGGAKMVFTPEMSGLLDRDRKRASAHIRAEDRDPVLKAVCHAASEHNVTVALGSLALKQDGGRLWVNRSFLISDTGKIAARYDKIHMFDVELATGETWRESAAFAPGTQAVTVPKTPVGTLGLGICYDMRFPALFERLGQARCDAIAMPAAFTVPTGHAHWHILLRARAIEASAFVIAAAQVGCHEDGRTTYGHSLVIDPWGDVILDLGGDEPGLGFCDLELERIAEIRGQLPSLANRRQIIN